MMTLWVEKTKLTIDTDVNQTPLLKIKYNLKRDMLFEMKPRLDTSSRIRNNL